MSKTKTKTKRPIAGDNPNDTQLNFRAPKALKEKYLKWMERLNESAVPQWSMQDMIIKVLQRAYEERGESGEP